MQSFDGHGGGPQRSSKDRKGSHPFEPPTIRSSELPGIYINLAEKETFASNKATAIRFATTKTRHRFTKRQFAAIVGQAYILGQEESKNSTPWLNPQHVGNQRRRRVYSLVNITAYSTTNPTKGPQRGNTVALPPYAGHPVCVAEGGERTCFSTKRQSAYPLLLTNQRKNKLTRKWRAAGIADTAPRGNPTHASISRSRRKHLSATTLHDMYRRSKTKRNRRGQLVRRRRRSDASRRQHHLLLRTSDKMQHFLHPPWKEPYNSIMRRQIIREAVDSLDEEDGCPISKVIRKVASIYEARHPYPLTTTDRPRACMDSRRTFSRRLTQ